MTRADGRRDYDDFYDLKAGPPLPLGREQLGLEVIQTAYDDTNNRFFESGVLPSGEHGGQDNRQLHLVRSDLTENLRSINGKTPSGINYLFPNPHPDFTPTSRLGDEGRAFYVVGWAHPSGQGDYLAYLVEDEAGELFTAEWWEASGILRTYPADVKGYTRGNPAMNAYNSGIFHWNSELDPRFPLADPIIRKGSLFSNGERVKSYQIKSFDLFNSYIHQHRFPDTPPPQPYSNAGRTIQIPYISTFKASIDFNAYK